MTDGQRCKCELPTRSGRAVASPFRLPTVAVRWSFERENHSERLFDGKGCASAYETLPRLAALDPLGDDLDDPRSPPHRAGPSTKSPGEPTEPPPPTQAGLRA